MKASERGLDLIKSFEGLRLKAYKCPAGVWTIGYGHTKGVAEGMMITITQADKFLREDIEDSERAVCRLVKSKITQSQFDALVSFVFNTGEGNFSRSTLLRKVNINPNNPDISREFKRWVYANGVILTGLKRRRDAEASLYFSK